MLQWKVCSIIRQKGQSSHFVDTMQHFDCCSLIFVVLQVKQQ